MANAVSLERVHTHTHTHTHTDSLNNKKMNIIKKDRNTSLGLILDTG